MPSDRTNSELLFQELCDLQGVLWTKLPELPDTRQPDYELTLGSQRIVAEIKEISPNDDDLAFTKALRERGRVSGTLNPDQHARRIRSDIRTSRGQLRSYLERNPGVPTILVIFDATDSRYDDPYIIQTTMYGWEEAVIATDGEQPVIVEQGFAPRNNRTIRGDFNQHLSALATLHEFHDFDTHARKLALRFYHNQQAAVPLPADLWQGPEIFHYQMGSKESGQYQNWELIP